MTEPRITVGVPVYRGGEEIGRALRCLQEQTYNAFEVIVSVDGGDAETAERCRPFLADPRFRMVVQPERLDWFGNLNWLLQQGSHEFFCYRQHDDTTSPDFFQVLLEAADRAKHAAIVYADCQWTGTRNDLEAADGIDGEPLQRLIEFVERLPATPVRGLIRRQAIAQAGLVRADEFRGLTAVFGWLAKLLRWGSFVRVPQPIYYRLDHAENFYKAWFDWPDERKRAAWTTLFTGLLEAALPVCRTPGERAFLLHLILDRVMVFRGNRPYLYVPATPDSSGRLMTECFERLRREGNLHLLEDVPAAPHVAAVLAEVIGRNNSEVERLNGDLAAARNDRARLEARLTTLDRSRMLRLGRRIRRLLGRPAD